MIARDKSLLGKWCEPVISTVRIRKSCLWLLALKDVGTESGGPVVFDLKKDEMNPDYWMLLYVKVVSDKTACKFCSISFRWEIFNIQKEICNNYGACSFNWLKRRSVDPILCVRVASGTRLWVKGKMYQFFRLWN